MREHQFDRIAVAMRDLDDAQLDLVEAFVRLLGDPSAATDGELDDAAVASFRLVAAVEGAAAPWLGRFEGTGAWGLDGARSPTAWLATHAEASKPRAGAVMKRARLLADTPVVAAAFAAGRLGAEKVRLLLHTRAEAPVPFGDQEWWLVDTVTGLTVAGTHVFLAAWLHAARPDGPDDGEPGRDDTHLQLSGTLGGSHVKGWLDTETAAVITGALDAEIDSWHRHGLLDGDQRTRPQLLAAALRAIAARHGDTATQHGTPRPLAIVLADADTLTGRRSNASTGEPAMDPVCEIVGHGPITADTARRLLCDADTSVVTTARNHTEVLDVGFRHRLATPAQRRALLIESRGMCQFPGCDAPHTWCQVHHLTPYDPINRTGPTDLHNLAYLCHTHHHAVHEGGFSLRRSRDGLEAHRPDGTPIHIPLHHRPPPPPADDDGGAEPRAA